MIETLELILHKIEVPLILFCFFVILFATIANKSLAIAPVWHKTGLYVMLIGLFLNLFGSGILFRFVRDLGLAIICSYYLYRGLIKLKAVKRLLDKLKKKQ